MDLCPARLLLRAPVAAFALFALSACPPADSNPIPGPAPRVDGPSCMFSHGCPEGTFCDLEQCTQACNSEKPCADGLVCTARGRCAATQEDPGDPAPTPAEGVLAVSPAVVRVTPDQGAFDLHLSGTGQVRVRLATDADWLTPAFVRGAFDDETDVSIAIDPSKLPAGTRAATIQVVSTQGDAVVVVHVPPEPQGVWQGSVAFTAVDLGGKKVPVDLGETRIGLHVRTDGAGLRAQLDPETSTLWPATQGGPITAAGATNPDGSMTFHFTALMDGDSAAPLYPAASPNVFRPTAVGRELTLTLAIDALGALKGTAVERIHGLTSTPVEVSGLAAFTTNAQGTLASFEAAAPVAMPSGPARDPGSAPSSCPPSDLWPECDANASAADRWSCLVEDELPRGYLLSNFYDPLNPARVPVFSLPPAPIPGSAPYADASATCAQELPADLRADLHIPPPNAPPGGTACINLEAMGCARFIAGTLYPERPELTAQANVYVARAYLELFTMLGNEAQVQAANERLSATASTSNIRAHLLDAKAAWDAGLFRLFDPRLFEELRGVSPSIAQAGPAAPVVVNDRAPVRLAAKAVQSSASAARRAFQIDLITATDLEGMHHKAQANAVLTWLQTALLADLGARWRGDAGALPEVDALGSTIRQEDALVSSTTSGVTPLGFSRTYVPLLARTSPADVQTNFERLFAIAQASVSASVTADAVASAEQREFDHSSQIIVQTLTDDVIRLQADLQEICGNAFLDDSGVPRELSRCGTTSGTAQDALLAITSAKLQLDAAFKALSAQHAIFESRTNTYAEIHGIKAEEIAFVTRTNKKILDLKIAQSALEATAAILGGLADGMDSFAEAKTLNYVGGSFHIAAGVAEAAAHALEPAQVELEQMQQVESLKVDQKITDLQDAQDLYEVALQFAQLRVQVALQENELARAANNFASLNEQVAALVGTYYQDQAALARATTIGVDPAFRIEQAADALAADVALEQGKRDLYLAARALEYESNADLSHITRAIFLAPTGKSLNALSACLSNAWNQWRLLVSSTNTYVTEISLARDVLGIDGAITDPATGRAIDPGAQFRRYLLDQPYTPDALHTWPALRFGTTLNRHSGLFSSLLCNDRIQSIEAKLVGPNLTGDRAEVQLLADGASQLRSCSATANEEQLISWTLRPRGQLAPAVVSAGINEWDEQSQPNQSLLEYAVSQDTFIVALPDPATSPANRELDVTKVDDIVLRITHAGVAAGSATGGFHPTCN